MADAATRRRTTPAATKTAAATRKPDQGGAFQRPAIRDAIASNAACVSVATAGAAGYSWQAGYPEGVALGGAATIALWGYATARHAAQLVRYRRRVAHRVAWSTLAAVTGDKPEDHPVRFRVKARLGVTPTHVLVLPADPGALTDTGTHAKLAEAWAAFTARPVTAVTVTVERGGWIRVRSRARAGEHYEPEPEPTPAPAPTFDAEEQGRDIADALRVVIDDEATVEVLERWPDGAPKALILKYPARATTRADTSRVPIAETMRRLYPPKGVWAVRWEGPKKRYLIEDRLVPVAPPAEPEATPDSGPPADPPAPPPAPAAQAPTQRPRQPEALTTTHHLHEENLEHALRPVIDPDGQVHVSAWSATGKPVRFALSYHARAASKAGGVRAKLIGTVEELLPLPAGHGWFLTWDSADRVYHFEARVDPLYETVPMPPILPPEKIDLSAVPVGIFDDRSPFTLNILDSDGATHYLIIGASGSGKSGPQMGLIRQLSPLIQIGVVRLWLFDPKGGMEFRIVKDLASGRFAVTKTERDKLRKQLQTELRSKADRLARAGMDKITTPTVEFPLDVVICDEVLSEVRDGKPAEFEEVLQIGRAAGMAFLAASQSPKLNDLPFKDLFLRILALRQARKHHVDMVLGDGARESGALCDKINEQTMRGVGYQAIDGQATMRRFRCAFTPQEERKRICVIYSRPVGQEPPASTRPVPAGQQPSLLEPDQIEPGSQVAVSELQPGDRFQWEGDPDPAVFVGAQEHDEDDRVLVDYTYGDSTARETDAEWTEMVTFLERPAPVT